MKNLLLTAALIFAAGAEARADGKLAFSGTEHPAERAAVLKADKNFSLYVSKGMMKESGIGIALKDLNGDGKAEILVYAESSMTCGSIGCMFSVYKQEDGALHKLLTVNAY